MRKKRPNQKQKTKTATQIEQENENKAAQWQTAKDLCRRRAGECRASDASMRSHLVDLAGIEFVYDRRRRRRRRHHRQHQTK